MMCKADRIRRQRRRQIIKIFIPVFIVIAAVLVISAVER